MEQRLSLVTLGVDDLPRARAFYESLGWRGQTVQQTRWMLTAPSRSRTSGLARTTARAGT